MNNLEEIKSKIFIIRGTKVMLDFELAELYQVPTKVLNQAYRRNIQRFPKDFAFQLTESEWITLRSQFVTLKFHKSKYLPTVYTEYGAWMLANILNSTIAIQISIAIIRIFNEVRHKVFEFSNLAERLSLIEMAVINNCTDMVDIKDQLLKLIKTVDELSLKTPSLPEDRKRIGLSRPEKKEKQK